MVDNLQIKVICGLPAPIATVMGTIPNTVLSYGGGLMGKGTQINLYNNIESLEIICGESSDEISIAMILKSGEKIIAACNPTIYRILYGTWKNF